MTSRTLTPADSSAIYLAKVLVNLSFLLVVELLLLPPFVAMYQLPINQQLGTWLLLVVAASVGLCTVGTLISSLNLSARNRELLLPILLFPVVLPVILPALKASNAFLQGFEMSEIWPWLNLLIAYDVVFIAVAFMVFDYVVEE